MKPEGYEIEFAAYRRKRHRAIQFALSQLRGEWFTARQFKEQILLFEKVRGEIRTPTHCVGTTIIGGHDFTQFDRIHKALTSLTYQQVIGQFLSHYDKGKPTIFYSYLP